jgi:hypothetical protein
MREVAKLTPPPLTPEEVRLLSAWARMGQGDRAAALQFMEASASAARTAAPALRLVKGGDHGKA